MRRPTLIRLAVLLASLALPPLAARAQSPEIGAAVAREIALVEFFGGSPLALEERAQLDLAVRQSFATDPVAAAHAAAESAQMMGMVQRPGTQLAVLRTLGRKAIAFEGLQALGAGPAGAAAAAIVARHDPVVVADAEHKFLVTRQTVLALVEGSRTGAPIFGVPAPGPDAAPELASRIQREWPHVDQGLREALSDASRTVAYAAPYLASRPGPARDKVVADFRQKILAAPDPEGVQFNLAEVMAFVGETGFKNRGSGGGDGALGTIMATRNRQAAIDRAGRALMPSCGVPAGSVQSPGQFAFCHPLPFS